MFMELSTPRAARPNARSAASMAASYARENKCAPARKFRRLVVSGESGSSRSLLSARDQAVDRSPFQMTPIRRCCRLQHSLGLLRIAEAVRDLNVDRALIDGEAVVLRDDGRSDFGALMTKRGGRRPRLWPSTYCGSKGMISACVRLRRGEPMICGWVPRHGANGKCLSATRLRVSAGQCFGVWDGVAA